MSYNFFTNKNEISRDEILFGPNFNIGETMWFNPRKRKYEIRNILVGYENLRFDFIDKNGVEHRHQSLEDLINVLDDIEQFYRYPIKKYLIIELPIPLDVNTEYSENPNSDYALLKDAIRGETTYQIEEEYGVEVEIKEFERCILGVEADIVDEELIYRN